VPSKVDFCIPELLTTDEVEAMFDPGVLGTPAPQPPGWDNFGAAAVCFIYFSLLRDTLTCDGIRASRRFSTIPRPNLPPTLD
jgi:hypothetical protein